MVMPVVYVIHAYKTATFVSDLLLIVGGKEIIVQDNRLITAQVSEKNLKL